MGWPSSLFDGWEVRSPIRWQHRLQREHPTCTERRSLTQSADGRVATVSADGMTTLLSNKNAKKLLDSNRPSHGSPLHFLISNGQRPGCECMSYAISSRS